MNQKNSFFSAFNKLTIKEKVFRLTGVLLFAIILIGGYGGFTVFSLYRTMQGMRGDIEGVREQSASVKNDLEKQQETLNRLETAERAHNTFGKFNYWLTDLSVSWLNEAEDQADTSKEALEKLLGQMTEYVPNEDLEKIMSHVNRIQELALEAVDAYIDENRVKGNSLLAQAKREMVAADAIFFSLVNRQREETKEAKEKATDTSNQTIRHAGEVISKANFSIEKATRNSYSGIGLLIAVVIGSIVITRFTVRSLESDQEEKLKRAKTVEKLVIDFEGKASDAIKTVESSSTALHQTAQQLTRTMTNVAARSENASSTSNETSGNVQSVASAAEELSTSVKEISSQIAKTSQVVMEVVGKAEAADKTTESLSKATDKIGNVLDMIKKITENINLLALNATIEAARAGESGKGFAVVASEVKTLAHRTKKATEEIAVLINQIQEASREVITVLNTIISGIRGIEEYTSGIASSVEEQSATTDEISLNMQTASKGVTSVSGNISEISDSSQEANESSKQVFDSAQILSDQAETLGHEVQTFLLGIKKTT